MPHAKVMSGTGDRASAYMPAVVATITPATSATPGSNRRRAIQHVSITTSRAPRKDGTTAARCDTAPAGQAASAINQAWSGGLLSMGPLEVSGKSQWPFARMSRAITGNRASSLVASTRWPRSKPKSAALPTLTIASGTHARSRERRLGPALMGQVVIAPGIEHHQGPEDLAMVSAAVDVLRGQPRHRALRDQAASSQRREAVLHDRTERAAQPGRDGNAEPLLASPHHARRQDARERGFQDVLRAPSPELQRARDRRRQLDESRIEKRRADLEARGHGGPVHGDQGLVREIEPGVVIDQALDRVSKRGLLDRADQLRIRIEARERPPHARGQETLLLGGRDAAEEELSPHGRRMGQPARELLEQEVDAAVRRRHGEAVDQPRHEASGGGPERGAEPSGRRIREKGRVSAEELVAAV